MRIFFLISTVFCLLLLNSHAASADIRLYTGTLEVVTTSGKACAGRKGNHQISLVFGNDENQRDYFGYIGGDTVTVGQLNGSSLDALALRYSFADAERAEGHAIHFEIKGTALTGELHDRHIEESVDDCNFDFARIKLLLNENDEAAHAVYKQLSKQYAAQLTRSKALSVTRSGKHTEAAELFEKALALADTLYPPDSSKLIPYLTGLANCYMRTGRYTDFNSLYSSRIAVLHDNSVRQIFDHHQIRSLLQVGRAALGREDYQTALYNFRQALKIDYKNKDVISANMSALVRSGKHDEAIAFLQETELKLESEPERKEVRETIALVEYQKSKKEQKTGKLSEAEQSLRKAIKLDPATAHYYIALARLIHKTGKYTEADDLLKRALEMAKDESQRKEIADARDKLRQTEIILSRIRKAGS